MQYTRQFGLAQWAANDGVDREVFNRDLLATDNALMSIAEGLHGTLINDYHTYGGRPGRYGIIYDGFGDAAMLDEDATTAAFCPGGGFCASTKGTAVKIIGENSFAKALQSNVTSYTCNVSTGRFFKKMELNISATAGATVTVSLTVSAKLMKTFTLTGLSTTGATVIVSMTGAEYLDLGTAATLQINISSSNGTFSVYTSSSSTSPYIKITYLNDANAFVQSAVLGGIHEQGARASCFLHCETSASAAPDIEVAVIGADGALSLLECVRVNPTGQANVYNMSFTGKMPLGPVKVRITMNATDTETIYLYGYSIMAT